MPRGRKKEPELKRCKSCQKDKKLDQFYLSTNPLDGDGRTAICRQCANDNVDINQLSSIHNMLIELNKPFIYDQWMTSLDESKRVNKNPWGLYLKSVFLNYKNLSWIDSVHESKSEDNESSDYQSIIKGQNETGYTLEELKEKYGYGYPDDEYILFEKKYQQLRSSFQLLTTMHEEYFREYCINKVKETLAKAKGNLKEAKEWAAMVKDVAEAGKLKPSQMSKADLSGGLDGFGQLARMVEENYEIQPLLPHFIEQPKDKVDVVLWYLVNYVRDLKGLPACEYKEIYDFYNRRKLEYESQMSDNTISSNDGNDDVDE